MKKDVHIENKQVGPSAHDCHWTRNKAGDTYETVCRGEKIYVVRRYPKQWVLRVGGEWLPYVFEGPKAAQRYAAGGVMSRAENPIPVAGIAAAAVAGTAAGFVLGKSNRKSKNPGTTVKTLKNRLLR